MNHKYISKFDYEKSCGYWVRLPEIKGGKYISYAGNNKFFSKTFHKTWKAALLAALKHRNKFIDKYPKLNLLDDMCGRLDKGMAESGRNSSGVIGVVLAVDVRGDTTYYAYIGQWSEDIEGERKQRAEHFSCDRYGHKQAFLYACRARFKKRGTLFIKDVDAIPCFPDVKYEVRL